MEDLQLTCFQTWYWIVFFLLMPRSQILDLNYSFLFKQVFRHDY